MMNLIDIASWQSGINLADVFKHNNLDGVIVKATQGTSYVNPDYAGWVKWLSDNDKPFGVYHYLDTSDPEKQADHFYKTVKPYIGKCVLCADYEAEALNKGTVWLRKFLARIYMLCGVRCMIYCSISVVQSQDFSRLTLYPLWIAQYADMKPVYGFSETPWQKGSVEPFDRYWMHQYTSCGKLNGYKNSLDFDKFYGSYSEWCELCRTDSSYEPEPTPAPSTDLKPADPQIVLRTIKNEFGIGEARRNAIRKEGYDPDSVQSCINRLYTVGAKVKKDIGGDMSYLNSILWIVRSI